MKFTAEARNKKIDEVFEYNDGNIILLLDLDNNVMGHVVTDKMGKSSVKRTIDLDEALEYFLNTRVRPSEIERIKRLVDMSTLKRRMERANYLIKEEILEYNGSDAWNIVDIVVTKAPDFKDFSENSFLVVHSVKKENVSIVESSGTIAEAYDFVEINPLTGLTMENSYRREVAKILAGTKKEYCIIYMDILHFKLFNKKYGHTAGDRLLSTIGSFLKNMDLIYGTKSAYGGGDNFYVFVENDKNEIEHIKKGINNIVSNFEGIKGFSTLYGAVVIEDKNIPVRELMDMAIIAASKKDRVHDEISWYEEGLEIEEENSQFVDKLEQAWRKKEGDGIPTRVDKYIDKMVARYLISGKYTDDEIIDFLKVVRRAFDVDTVYINILTPEKNALLFLFEAAKDGRFAQQGHTVPIDNEKLKLILGKNEDVDEAINLKIDLGAGVTFPNALQRSFLRDKNYDGSLGMATYYNREWTDEERQAIVRAGALLRYVVETNRLTMLDRFIQRSRTVDTLTNLLNRSAFDAYMEETKEIGKGVCVIYADLDGLKECNDKYGHDAGDKLIVRTANALMSYFPYQSIFRFGGDEFVIIEWNISEEELKEKMIDFFSYLDTEGDLSMSLGVVWDNADCDVKDMIREADKRMYESKRHFHKTGKHEMWNKREEK